MLDRVVHLKFNPIIEDVMYYLTKDMSSYVDFAQDAEKGEEIEESKEENNSTIGP